MHPLEHRHRACQGAFHISSSDAEGWGAVRLQCGADRLRTAVEQRLAAHLEEAAGVVVDIDEFAGIDIEYHDHLGSMLHQSAVAPLAFAHGLFGQMPFGGVAYADDVAVLPVEIRLADGNLHSNAISPFGKTP